MLASLHGLNPTPFQLIGSYGIGVASAAFTLIALGVDWETLLLAFLVLDWTTGVVANSAETARAWWRERPRFRIAFIAVHLLELPLVFWLSGGARSLSSLPLFCLQSSASSCLARRLPGTNSDGGLPAWDHPNNLTKPRTRLPRVPSSENHLRSPDETIFWATNLTARQGKPRISAHSPDIHPTVMTYPLALAMRCKQAAAIALPSMCPIARFKS